MKIIITVLTISLSLMSMGAKSNEEDKTALYFKSKEFQKQLFDMGVYWDRNILNIQTNCKSKYHLKPISFGFLKPLEFNSDGVYPTQGVMTVRYTFSRCNETITYNALISAQEGKTPKIAALVPGTTRASPQLLRDLYIGGVSGMVAKKRKNKECKKTSITNTVVTLEPSTITQDGKEFNGAWEEFWTVKHCDEQIDMTFCLIPDGKGGTSWTGGKCAG